MYYTFIGTISTIIVSGIIYSYYKYTKNGILPLMGVNSRKCYEIYLSLHSDSLEYYQNKMFETSPTIIVNTYFNTIFILNNTTRILKPKKQFHYYWCKFEIMILSKLLKTLEKCNYLHFDLTNFETCCIEGYKVHSSKNLTYESATKTLFKDLTLLLKTKLISDIVDNYCKLIFNHNLLNLNYDEYHIFYDHSTNNIYTECDWLICIKELQFQQLFESIIKLASKNNKPFINYLFSFKTDSMTHDYTLFETKCNKFLTDNDILDPDFKLNLIKLLASMGIKIPIKFLYFYYTYYKLNHLAQNTTININKILFTNYLEWKINQ